MSGRGANTEGAIAERLATLGLDRAATVRRSPSSTILPPDAAPDSQHGHALAVLGNLGRDRFRVERTLGEGGMGVVHLAEQRSMGRHVAVKTLKPEHHDPASSMRLLREAWVTGSLEHPNVVPVYDVALNAAGAPQVVLKRIEGVDWASLLQRPDDLRDRAEGDVEEWNLRTLIQVCNAVHFAHDRGVIHRDLKPENVMIGSFGEVYVVDWGIAVSLREDGDPRLPRAAQATDLAGTPLYMAPEMLLGDPARLGVRTDVYLLGAILFELVTGRPPHEGPTLEAIFAHVFASPPAVPSSVPEELAAVCRRAMAPNPEDRFATVLEFRKALSDYLEHRGSMRLARRAQRGLTEFLDEVRDAQEEGDGGRIHHLFGECRFGFRAALDAWAENDVAKGGLRLALKAMAEHEISSGNLEAARRLVAELEDAPEDLRRRVAALEQARAADARERARLEALGQELDPTTGSRTRLFLSIIFGSSTAGLPAVSHFVLHRTGQEPGPVLSMAIALGLLPLVLGLGYWARDSMMKTQLNRRVFAVTAFTLVAQVLLSALTIVANIEPVTAVTLNLFLWFTVMGIVVITVERRLWPTAIGYAAALAAALAWPDTLFLLMGAANGVLTVNAIVIWGPTAHLLDWRPGGRSREG